MSRILEASANAAGVVTVDGIVVPGVTLLSEGKQVSTGVLLMQGDKLFYIPSAASDLKTSLEKIISTLEDIASAFTTVGDTLTAIGANMTGDTTAPPPVLPTNVLEINSKVAELNTLKTELTTLKGALK